MNLPGTGPPQAIRLRVTVALLLGAPTGRQMSEPPPVNGYYHGSHGTNASPPIRSRCPHG